MRKENSGFIYRFPLDFKLGYAYAEFVDYIDESSFEGLMLYAFNLVHIQDDIKPLNEIIKSGFMFGPVPVVKKPNVKGKGAWKLAGRTEKFNEEYPTFKSVRNVLTVKDWSTIGPWYIRKPEPKDCRDAEDYEQVRSLEIPILSSTLGIQHRATMQYLISKGEDVGKFYNLKEAIYWMAYTKLANTSYPEKKAKQLLEKIDDKPSIRN